jgi:hypothetical protein
MSLPFFYGEQGIYCMERIISATFAMHLPEYSMAFCQEQAGAEYRLYA